MSTSEKLVIRRRTAAPKVAATPAPVETAVAPQAPATPVAPQKVAPAPKAEVATPVDPAIAAQLAAQKAQDEADKQQITLPEFFMPGAPMREINLAEAKKNYKPQPIKAAIVLNNPNYKAPETQEAEAVPQETQPEQTPEPAPLPPEASYVPPAEPEPEETPVVAAEEVAPKAKKTMGKRVKVEKLDPEVAKSLESQRPGIRKINEKQFFSEGHKESVIKNNNFVENNQTQTTVFAISDNTAFLELLNKGEKAVKIAEDDAEYAKAASRSVIASISSAYSVVLLHSNYQVSFTGLRYLSKSRLLTQAESLYLDRRRLYEVAYNQIESMTGGKPSLEKWLKMTAFKDTPSILFGLYAATYPGPQNFELTCPNCGNKMKVPTDPESIVAVYDQNAYDRVRDVVNTDPSTTEIIKQSALSKIYTVDFPNRQSVFYIKEPSIQDFLDILADVTREPELYQLYGDVYETTMFVDHALIPDIAHYERTGEVRFVKLTDKKLLAKFIANLTDEEGEAFDNVIDSLNNAYDVQYEIPEFTCNGLLKDENGNWTSEPCNQKIEKRTLDIEKILFHYLQRKPAKPKE